MTGDEAKAVAAAGILQAADRPGLTDDRQAAGDPEGASAENFFIHCYVTAPASEKKPQTLPLSYLAFLPGRVFSDGPLRVKSAAEARLEAADAQFDFAIRTSPHGATCLRDELVRESRGLPVRRAAVTSHPVTIRGADKAVCLSVDFYATDQKNVLRSAGYMCIALLGQFEVTMQESRNDGTSPPLRQVTALLQTVVNRVHQRLA